MDSNCDAPLWILCMCVCVLYRKGEEVKVEEQSQSVRTEIKLSLLFDFSAQRSVTGLCERPQQCRVYNRYIKISYLCTLWTLYVR